MAKQFDVAVIGSGPAGYVAAIRAAQLGLKTVCIEKMATLGGTCLNVGCIPSKALLQTSENYVKTVKEWPNQGIHCDKITFDLEQVMKRKEQVVKSLVDGVAGLFKRNQITRIDGKARLTSAHMIEVEKEGQKQVVEAENIIIATGSEPISLPFLPIDEKKIVSSTGVLSLQKIPKKMVVVGAGAIGLELASVYQRFGTEVSIVEMLDRVCPTMDLSISKAMLQILKKQGLQFYLSTKVVKAADEKGTMAVSIEGPEGNKVLHADIVLVSIGRKPYTQGVGLKEVGVELDAKGFVVVDDQFRTSIPNIYAIGDVIEGPMLAHKGSEEGIAVAEILSGRHPHINYMAIPNVVYTSPEVAAVGMTEKEARDAGFEVKIGTAFMRGNARARCADETEGFVKVLGDGKSGRLLGMHIIASHASEMIGEGVLAIEKRATLEDVANASHAHPTLTEAIKEAALGALSRAIHV